MRRKGGRGVGAGETAKLMAALLLCWTTSLAMADVSSHTFFRQTRWPDRGAIHVLLANNGKEVVSLRKIVVDDRLSFTVTNQGFRPYAELDELLADVPGIPSVPNRLPLIERDYLPQNVQPGDVLWYWAPTYTLEPGERTELVIEFSATPTAAVNLGLSWSDGSETRLTVDPQPANAYLSAIAFEPDLRKLYAYVRNNSGAAISVERALVNGQCPDDASTQFVNRIIEPGETGVVALKLIRPLSTGQWTCVQVEMSDGHNIFGTSRALTGFPVIQSGGRVIKPDPGCLSNDGVKLKSFGRIDARRLDICAEKVIANRCKPGYVSDDEYFTFWASQGFIKWAASGLAELTDAASLHLQPSEVRYLGRYSTKDFHYVQAKARYLRECFAPRPVFGHIEVGHASMSGGYVGLLTPEEFRLRCYYMVSRGIKGVLYRCGGGKLEDRCTAQERRALTEEIDVINEELERLRPYLRVAEFVEGVATCTEPQVEPATLLAGDKAIVLLLLNHDRQQSWPQNEMHLKDSFFLEPVRAGFTVSLSVPQGIEIKRIVEIAGDTQFRIPFRFEAGRLAFDVPSLRATRQYILQAENRDGAEALASPEYPVRERDGPKAVFMTKQAFLGVIIPSKEACKAEFRCRNSGNRPLTLEYAPQGDNSTSFAPHRIVVKPDGDVRLTASCLRASLGILHKVFHIRTNDTDRPRIQLHVGAEIRPEVVVAPVNLAISKTSKPTGRLLVSDNSIEGLRLNRVWSADPRLDIKVKENRTVVANCPMAVYRRNDVRHYYEISVEPDYDQTEDNADASLHLETNSVHPEYARMTVPISIVVHTQAIIASPKSVVFYSNGTKAERRIRLSSRGRSFKVLSVTSEQKNISLSLRESTSQASYEVVATWEPSEEPGIYRGQIKATVVQDGRESVMTIPYSAVAR